MCSGLSGAESKAMPMIIIVGGAGFLWVGVVEEDLWCSGATFKVWQV